MTIQNLIDTLQALVDNNASFADAKVVNEEGNAIADYRDIVPFDENTVCIYFNN